MFVRLIFIAFGFWVTSGTAFAVDVTYAGLAYAGSRSGQEVRFPYSLRLDALLKAELLNDVKELHPSAYKLTLDHINSLAATDQAIAVALVITNETSSVENLGPVQKLFTYVRAQALFFDLKSMTVVRAYPLSFVFLDTTTATPTDQQKLDAMKIVYFGRDGKPGILQRFEVAITNATLPTNVSKTVGITSVILGTEAKQAFPVSYGEGESEIWVADQLAEAISQKSGIPVLPYKKGYATGRLLYVINENSYNVEIPKPDYEIDVELSRLRIVPFDTKPAGRSLIYASYANIKVELRESNGKDASVLFKNYLTASFKNGVTKIVPASQNETDDFPAYQDSILGLFGQFADAVEGVRTPWLKAATVTPDIEKQLISTQTVFAKCK